MEKLDFYEAAAKANAAAHLATAEYLAKEAHQTLMLLLSGAGGAVAYGVGLFDKPQAWAAWALMAAGAYLFLLASVLVFSCLRIADAWPPANEPGNLMREESIDWTIDELRIAELESQQRCIDRNKQRNNRVADWLTRIRVATPATFLVFIAAAVVVLYR